MNRLSLVFHLRQRRLSPRMRQIQLLVCDVDGVLTDGGLHYDEQGRVVKRFDVRDGLAIRMLQRAGLEVAFLSGGRSGAIEQRARHLQVGHCLVGVGDKLSALKHLQATLQLERKHTAFIGDDLNDLTVRPAPPGWRWGRARTSRIPAAPPGALAGPQPGGLAGGQRLSHRQGRARLLELLRGVH